MFYLEAKRAKPGFGTQLRPEIQAVIEKRQKAKVQNNDSISEKDVETSVEKKESSMSGSDSDTSDIQVPQKKRKKAVLQSDSSEDEQPVVKKEERDDSKEDSKIKETKTITKKEINAKRKPVETKDSGKEKKSLNAFFGKLP